jgi:hypothetical protein
MKAKRRLSASEAIDRICQRELGLPLDKCATGNVSVEAVVAALEELRDIIEPSDAWHGFFGEKEERETDDVVARMAETGSFDPIRFLPIKTQSYLRATISVAITEYRDMPISSRRLCDMPDRLQGCALGLAALACSILRP